MAAQDGQTLDQQSPETQAAFSAAYGGNASSAWENEHNQAIGAGATPAAAPSAPAGVPQTAGGGGGTTTIDPTQTMQGLTPEQVAKMRAGITESSGLSIKQLNEQMREFDQQLDWQKQMWQQQGLPQFAIQQRAADLEQQKFEQLAAQATRQQNWVEQIGTRQAALAEKAQADANAIAQGQLGVAQGQLGLGQSQLGLDTLKTAATLTGRAADEPARLYQPPVDGPGHGCVGRTCTRYADVVAAVDDQPGQPGQRCRRWESRRWRES